MNKTSIRLLSVLTLLTTTSAYAVPIQWSSADGGNDHYYDVVSTTPQSWEASVADAAATTYLGMTGHMVTITSAEENTFVFDLMQSIGHVSFLGGSDSVTEGLWQWVTGETWDYENWSPGEPNNCCGGEDYLSFLGNGTWYDIQGLNQGNGYIIEFGTFGGPVNVPEPHSLLLFLAALLGIYARRRYQMA